MNHLLVNTEQVLVAARTGRIVIDKHGARYNLADLQHMTVGNIEKIAPWNVQEVEKPITLSQLQLAWDLHIKSDHRAQFLSAADSATFVYFAAMLGFK